MKKKRILIASIIFILIICIVAGVFLNKDNTKISGIEVANGDSNSMIHTDITQLDPIVASNQFIHPYTSKVTYQGEVKDSGYEMMTLNETFDEFLRISESYKKCPAGISIAAIALYFRVSLNAVSKWVEASRVNLSKQNTLLDDILICNEKTFRFRYGREIFLLQESTREGIYDKWSSGTIRYTLTSRGTLYDENNCIEYMITDMPRPMTLCNEYYWDLGMRLTKLKQGR